jgi:hypothetical protein
VSGQIAVECESRATPGQADIDMATIGQQGGWAGRQLQVLDDHGSASWPAEDDQIDTAGRSGEPYLLAAKRAGLWHRVRARAVDGIAVGTQPATELVAPSLLEMFCRCRATVCSLITSVDEISRLVRPMATSRYTCSSRVVSPLG